MLNPRVHLSTPNKRLRSVQSVIHDQTECKRSILRCCKDNFQQYLLNTTLHGLKYIGDATITRLERLFFLGMFLLVVFSSAYFISNVWNKWNATPIIITQSAISFSVKDFPFPAITLCNMNHVQKSAVLSLDRNSEEYVVAQNLCGNKVDEHLNITATGMLSVFRKVLVKVSQPCEEMLVSCKFGGIEYDCMKIFSFILSDGGLCCNFNGLHKKFMSKLPYNRSDDFLYSDYMEKMANDWLPANGFKKSANLIWKKEGYPRPGIGAGSRLGLSLVLNVATNEYYCSSTLGFGFKVVLHAPHEMPQIDEYGLGIANGYESRIVTTPVISGASKAVQRTPVKIRQCVYQSENFLTYYRVYSRENCESECVAKVYSANCNCVLYYMPKLHRGIRICGRMDEICINGVQQELQMGLNESFKCDCYYACDAIKFDMGFSTNPIYENAPFLKTHNLTAPNTTILHVYYQRAYYRGQNMEELIGFTEFLSNIGGLLGLFMGFSAFSIIEIIYFLSIRPGCNFMKKTMRRRKTLRRLNHNRMRGAIDNVNQSIMNNTIFPQLD